jgi:hypothetical protein
LFFGEKNLETYFETYFLDFFLDFFLEFIFKKKIGELFFDFFRENAERSGATGE